MTAQTCPQNIELEDPLPLFEDRSNQEVKTTTCYMCACRCGIKVTLEGKKVRYIQGNRTHPINKEVLCAKGNAGIMKHESMAKLRAPLRRIPGTERGDKEFEVISWDEALDELTARLEKIRATDPKKLAFFLRKRSNAGTNQPLSSAIWHCQLVCSRWILFSQHGFCWTLYIGSVLLGVWRTRLG